jgi:hypothetical protein
MAVLVIAKRLEQHHRPVDGLHAPMKFVGIHAHSSPEALADFHIVEKPPATASLCSTLANHRRYGSATKSIRQRAAMPSTEPSEPGLTVPIMDYSAAWRSARTG